MSCAPECTIEGEGTVLEPAKVMIHCMNATYISVVDSSISIIVGESSCQ
jgi:hypothetical protein